MKLPTFIRMVSYPPKQYLCKAFSPLNSLSWHNFSFFRPIEDALSMQIANILECPILQCKQSQNTPINKLIY